MPDAIVCFVVGRAVVAVDAFLLETVPAVLLDAPLNTPAVVVVEAPVGLAWAAVVSVVSVPAVVLVVGPEAVDGFLLPPPQAAATVTAATTTTVPTTERCVRPIEPPRTFGDRDRRDRLDE
jgi:hypothetical protein